MFYLSSTIFTSKTTYVYFFCFLQCVWVCWFLRVLFCLLFFFEICGDSLFRSFAIFYIKCTHVCTVPNGTYMKESKDSNGTITYNNSMSDNNYTLITHIQWGYSLFGELSLTDVVLFFLFLLLCFVFFFFVKVVCKAEKKYLFFLKQYIMCDINSNISGRHRL